MKRCSLRRGLSWVIPGVVVGVLLLATSLMMVQQLTSHVMILTQHAERARGLERLIAITYAEAYAEGLLVVRLANVGSESLADLYGVELVVTYVDELLGVEVTHLLHWGSGWRLEGVCVGDLYDLYYCSSEGLRGFLRPGETAIIIATLPSAPAPSTVGTVVALAPSGAKAERVFVVRGA